LPRCGTRRAQDSTGRTSDSDPSLDTDKRRLLKKPRFLWPKPLSLLKKKKKKSEEEKPRSHPDVPKLISLPSNLDRL
jgi:hypothetical protein